MKKIIRNSILGLILVFLIVILILALSSKKSEDIVRLSRAQENETKQVTAGVGAQSELDKFLYYKNDTNYTVKLAAYKNTTETTLTIYSKYLIDGTQYSTVIEWNMVSASDFIASPSTNNLKTIIFQDGIEWKGEASKFFQNCKNLEYVDFGGVNFTGVQTLGSTSTSLRSLFSGCSKLTTVDFNSADFDIITDGALMFSGCSSLTTINFGNFTGENLTSMSSMFYNCSSLKKISINNFNTSNVTDMSSMFYKCTSLTNLDLSNFNTSNVTRMYNMFDSCTSLTNLILSSFDTSNVTDMSKMFYNCSALTNLNVSNFDTSSVTDMSLIFYNCSALTSLDLSSFDTSNVTNMRDIFYNCSALASLNISNFNTSNVTNMRGMFYKCSSLTNLDLSNLDTSKVSDMSSMFEKCSTLTSLNLSNFNTKNVIYMNAMFAGCSSLTSLDVSSFNTGNVTNMGSMFENCSSLTSLNLRGFDTKNVTGMSSIFKNCSSLTNLNVDNFNTSNITSMKAMFNNCSSLTSLNVSSLDTSNVTDMSYMFYKCSSLTSLNMSNFDTSNVTDMSYMFYECSSMTSIDLSNWNTSNVTAMSNMFSNCDKMNEVFTPYLYPTTTDFRLPSTSSYLYITYSNENDTTDNIAYEGVFPKSFSGSVHLIKCFKIIFNSNGGTGTMSAQAKRPNITAQVVDNSFIAPDGKMFTNWNTSSNGNGEIYNPGDTYTNNANLTLYAQWENTTFTVTFKDGENVINRQTVNYGENAIAPILTKAGYTLSWDKDFSNVTSSITVNAVWTANTNTKYKVEHYRRNLDSEVIGYDLYETEELTGTTDEIVTATAKTYTGFTENTTHSDRIASGTIAGDGSLILKLYYDRNSYSITYDLNGGTEAGNLTKSYTYGKEIILSNKVEKQGYTFKGWYDNSGLTGTAVTAISATEIGNKIFYAKWVSDDQYYIISEKHNIDVQENYITKVSPNTNVQTLISNLNTNGTAKVLNAKGEELAKDALVGTGCKVQVDYKGTKYEYEVAVRGDIDGNGKITVTDLSMLNQVLVKKLTVTGVKEKATDIDYSKKITVTDLSMMNQALVGKINL